MDVVRHCLGWERPLLAALIDHLTAEHDGGSELDLSARVVVLSGARAGRMALSGLVSWADARHVALAPPLLLTPGQLPGLLLPVPGRSAGDTARRLAWIEALRQTPGSTLRALIPSPPDPEDTRANSAYATLLERCHRDIAGAGLRFADVPARAETVFDGLDEATRWDAAAAVQDRYARLLADSELSDPHLAWVDALRSAPSQPGTHHITLAGVPDLPLLARRALEHGAATVEVLVFAPEHLSQHFDALGCLDIDHWSTADVPLADDRIFVADRPGDQADAALCCLAQLGGAHTSDDVVIGAPDGQVTGHLVRRAERFGIMMRPALGMPLSRSGPSRLLRAIATFIDTGDAEAFASLLRHPDFEAALLRTATHPSGRPRSTEWWLEAFDRERADHLIDQVTGRWRSTHRRAVLEAMYQGVRLLLRPLMGKRGQPDRRTAGAWSERMLAVLRGVYGGKGYRRSRPDERTTIDACERLRDGAVELSRFQRGPLAHPMRASEAIGLLLEVTDAATLPDPALDDAVELLGWLEVASDPSPVVVLTGMNEGHIPGAVAVDPLLPDGLRHALGLPDDRARHARDAYLLAAIVASRPSVSLICGRRSSEGEPLVPSRLLFQCPPTLAAERLARLSAEEPAMPEVRLDQRPRSGPRDRFFHVSVMPHDPVETMSVTSFRTFLASPYLFYLQSIERLRVIEDRERELAPPAFGSMLHVVLDRFGHSSLRDSTNVERVRDFLCDTLHDHLRAHFGRSPRAAIQLQALFAEQRLACFAQWQTQRAREGWRIEQTEMKMSGSIDVDGAPMMLRGTIDRIDRHSVSGAMAIIDYKTSDTPKSPEQTHRHNGVWRDLQLPLYRHLVGETDGPISLGYIVLPRDPKVELLEADWSPADLRDADDTTHDVIRLVRRGQFDVLGDVGWARGAVASLCGVGFLGIEEEAQHVQ
ncbi:MAG: PD-(D/E)XK nuclease family protein [Planctomycetota bacterium]